MRDIGSRIQRYRLSRYASPSGSDPWRWRWLWVAVVAWLAWAGLLSDHSFFRLWRLDQEQRRTARELALTHGRVLALEKERTDASAQRERTERQLRRAGMARPNEIIYRIRESEPGDNGH